jgi:hypothetical protein
LFSMVSVMDNLHFFLIDLSIIYGKKWRIAMFHLSFEHLHPWLLDDYFMKIKIVQSVLLVTIESLIKCEAQRLEVDFPSVNHIYFLLAEIWKLLKFS